jgi:hypothetical protein
VKSLNELKVIGRQVRDYSLSSSIGRITARTSTNGPVWDAPLLNSSVKRDAQKVFFSLRQISLMLQPAEAIL